MSASWKIRHLLPACLVVAAMTQPAASSEFIFAVGTDDVLDHTGTQAAAVRLEYHLGPFLERGRFKLKPAVALYYDADDDLWVGAGVAGVFDLNERWFLEGSLLAGYYDPGPGGTQLGHELEFSTLVGAGYRFSETRAISLAIDHKSNHGLSDTNPGSETVMLRYQVRF